MPRACCLLPAPVPDAGGWKVDELELECVLGLLIKGDMMKGQLDKNGAAVMLPPRARCACVCARLRAGVRVCVRVLDYRPSAYCLSDVRSNVASRQETVVPERGPATLSTCCTTPRRRRSRCWRFGTGLRGQPLDERWLIKSSSSFFVSQQPPPRSFFSSSLMLLGADNGLFPSTRMEILTEIAHALSFLSLIHI